MLPSVGNVQVTMWSSRIPYSSSRCVNALIRSTRGDVAILAYVLFYVVYRFLNFDVMWCGHVWGLLCHVHKNIRFGYCMLLFGFRCNMMKLFGFRCSMNYEFPPI